jgi:hypothetical protein
MIGFLSLDKLNEKIKKKEKSQQNKKDLLRLYFVC